MDAAVLTALAWRGFSPMSICIDETAEFESRRFILMLALIGLLAGLPLGAVAAFRGDSPTRSANAIESSTLSDVDVSPFGGLTVYSSEVTSSGI
jgi:hypothetical protein